MRRLVARTLVLGSAFVMVAAFIVIGSRPHDAIAQGEGGPWAATKWNSAYVDVGAAPSTTDLMRAYQYAKAGNPSDVFVAHDLQGLARYGEGKRLRVKYGDLIEGRVGGKREALSWIWDILVDGSPATYRQVVYAYRIADMDSSDLASLEAYINETPQSEPRAAYVARNLSLASDGVSPRWTVVPVKMRTELGDMWRAAIDIEERVRKEGSVPSAKGEEIGSAISKGELVRLGATVIASSGATSGEGAVMKPVAYEGAAGLRPVYSYDSPELTDFARRSSDKMYIAFSKEVPGMKVRPVKIVTERWRWPTVD